MPADQPLSDLFRESLGRDPPPEFVKDPALEDVLRGVVMSARAAWPAIALAPDVFVPYLARRFPKDAESLGAFDDVRVTDLWLACACAHGDAAAITVFIKTRLAPIFPLPRDLAPLSSEVEQLASVKLLVPQGSDLPKIADYSGRGDLGSWVGIVALRIALGLLRKEKPEVEIDDSILSGLPVDDDAEVAHLKKRYRAEFAAAFQHALTTLAPRDRNVLRQYYVDGLAMDQIGRIYRVHRITVVRWIEKARTKLAAATRDDLVSRFGIDRTELDSIARLIQSQLDLSLRAYLRTNPGA